MILYAVILNGVKNLEVSVAVVGSASLEILRCTQDDIESVRLPRLVPSLAMTVDSVWSARRCFDFVQNDTLREIATVAMLPRNDASGTRTSQGHILATATRDFSPKIF